METGDVIYVEANSGAVKVYYICLLHADRFTNVKDDDLFQFLYTSRKRITNVKQIDKL